MDPVTAGLIAGTVIPAVGSYFGQSNANYQNRKMAREQMAFQERMSNTAYQRAVQDMRLSGINPMLAYMQGGASSPGGAQATMQDAIGPAVASAQHGRRLAGEIEMMQSQTEKTRQEGLLTAQQRLTNSEFLQPLMAEQREHQFLQNRLLRYQMPAAANQAASEQNLGGVRRTIRDWREAIFGGGIVAPFRIGGGR